MWSKLVSMERSDDEKIDAISSYPIIAPDYPPGLKICLCEDELEKLDLDDPEVGDYLDMRAFARVTSVSREQMDGKVRRRVELTIEQIAVEDEDKE